MPRWIGPTGGTPSLRVGAGGEHDHPGPDLVAAVRRTVA